MSKFTPAEIAYLRSQMLGRLATVDGKGDLHVMPVNYRYNPEEDAIDFGGLVMKATQKYRDAIRHGRVAFVVDDILPPGQARLLEIRGTTQAADEGGRDIHPDFQPDVLRVRPIYIVSAGINEAFVGPREGKISFRGRHAE
jgi:pyridoxamine 5'-phosphate oxidase family protein